MKWYDRIGIVVWCLILFPSFILLSAIAHLTGLVWWPEFFLIMAETALSVLVVLFIIEASSRRERKLRWEPVKELTYLRILERLRLLGYFVCCTTFMVWLEPLSIDREKIEREGVDPGEAAFILKTLANSIREHYILLFDLYKIPLGVGYKDEDPMEQAVKDLIECFDNIKHEIDEYKIALVPRVLTLSDDVEVNAALLSFEEVHSIFYLREDFLKRYNPDWQHEFRKYIALGENFVDPAFLSLADLLNEAANLYDLITRHMLIEPENGLIAETTTELQHQLAKSMQELTAMVNYWLLELKHQIAKNIQELKSVVKYWWLPPSCWQDNC